jgi:hypothetical protein
VCSECYYILLKLLSGLSDSIIKTEIGTIVRLLEAPGANHVYRQYIISEPAPETNLFGRWSFAPLNVDRAQIVQ